ncbi:MAG TPA: KH domain-containing protein [Firmicutes bacterium]|nr:KH domain-containing protein [Bacillota bacterium]
MKELVELLAKSLVDHADEVYVRKEESADTILLEITVNKDDLGKIIGRKGRVIKAIRTLVWACAPVEKRVMVELAE